MSLFQPVLNEKEQKLEKEFDKLDFYYANGELFLNLMPLPLRGTGQAGRTGENEPVPGGSSQSLATTGYPNGSLSGCSIQMPALQMKTGR